jgi:rhodanese-related sulfurtransferase
MPTDIGRDQVQRLVGQGACLVEVLPEAEYQAEHLAGAISLPLTRLTRETAARLPRARPVIVYCSDHQ